MGPVNDHEHETSTIYYSENKSDKQVQYNRIEAIVKDRNFHKLKKITKYNLKKKTPSSFRINNYSV